MKKPKVVGVLPYNDASRKKRLAGITRKDRLDGAIVIPPTVRVGERVEVAYRDLDRLGIDERYQRPEQKPMVNQIVRALKAGGQIADHIHVAVRKDGSWWIVDGQQRWNAAILGEAASLRAQLYFVPDLATEQKLFLVFNSRARVHANVIVKSWPGPAGELIRWLAEDEQSPLRGAIGFSPGNHTTNATTLARILLAVLHGRASAGSTEHVLRYLDAAVRRDPTRAKVVAKALAILMKFYFNGHHMLARQALPIAGAAHAKWGTGVCRMPTKGEIGRIRRLPWEKFAAPSLAPYAQTEVEKRWRS